MLYRCWVSSVPYSLHSDRLVVIGNMPNSGAYPTRAAHLCYMQRTLRVADSTLVSDPAIQTNQPTNQLMNETKAESG